jgi:hypothetical protein
MEITYAYLAGAVDVDGFISISRQSRVERFHYFATVGFSDVSPIVPNLLHEVFPGHLYQSQPKRPTNTASYFWIATRTRAREPLLRFLPHLRLKRRQAELTLELIDLMEQQNAARSTNKPSAAIMQRFERFSSLPTAFA